CIARILYTTSVLGIGSGSSASRPSTTGAGDAAHTSCREHRDLGGTPRDGVVQAEVPHGRNSRADQVGDEIVYRPLMVEIGQHAPVDRQSSDVDRDIATRAGKDPSAPAIMPGPDLVEVKGYRHRDKDRERGCRRDRQPCRAM